MAQQSSPHQMLRNQPSTILCLEKNCISNTVIEDGLPESSVENDTELLKCLSMRSAGHLRLSSVPKVIE